MKVKQLIRELKKMPQNLVVDVAMPDNHEHESSGSVCALVHFIKSDYDDNEMSAEAKSMLRDMPDECIILRC